MDTTLREKWLRSMGIGFHAMLASMVSAGLVNLLFLAASAAYYLIFDDTKELEWLETTLGILFYILVGIPVFGFFFSSLYPKTDVVPNEASTNQTKNEPTPPK